MFVRLNDKSRMKREFHVRFCESLKGKCLGATRPLAVNVNEMSDTFELAQDDIQFKAPIEQVDLQVLESFPVQVNVKVKGWFTNGCQQIDQIKVTPTDNTFMVTMTTTPPPPPEIACTMALAPFEKTIALDVQGLKQGVYTVDVNGIRKQFELAVDNVVVGN